VDDKSIRRMRIRSFRKMIYENHFDKEYLELEQKKKELEMRIESSLKSSDVKMAKNLCDELEEIIAKMKID
jgi:ATP-binding cassette subfamily F protein 3